MAFNSPVYTPTSEPYNPEPQFDAEALASMSPELLGSARLPPMSPEERQRYIDGTTLKAKYVGTIEVPESKGEQMVITAINRVRTHHKAQKENKERVWLNISTSGLKILHFDNYSIQDSYALSQIAYTTILPSNRRVFAFVSANTSVQPPIFKCHVFKSNSKASLITLTLGRCFSIALEEARARGVQFRNGSSSVTPTAPGAVFASRADAAFPRAGFHQIMQEIEARTGQLGLNPSDLDYLGLRCNQLTMLYEDAQHKLEDAERRVMAARSSIRR